MLDGRDMAAVQSGQASRSLGIGERTESATMAAMRTLVPVEDQSQAFDSPAVMRRPLILFIFTGEPFGPSLKTARGRLSQSKLAERAGFDHSYVSRLESGARTPTKDAVGQLSNALNLDRYNAAALQASAGFLSEDTDAVLAYLLRDDPDLVDAVLLLRDPAVDSHKKNMVRRVVRAVIR